MSLYLPKTFYFEEQIKKKHVAESNIKMKVSNLSTTFFLKIISYEGHHTKEVNNKFHLLLIFANESGWVEGIKN